MRRSVFCLCPPGRVSWTPRLIEAAVLGCIPVLLSDKYILPFADHLPYEDAIVRVPETSLDQLPAYLERAAADAEWIRGKQRALQKLVPMLVYDSEEGPMWRLLSQVLADKSGGCRHKEARGEGFRSSHLHLFQTVRSWKHYAAASKSRWRYHSGCHTFCWQTCLCAVFGRSEAAPLVGHWPAADGLCAATHPIHTHNAICSALLFERRPTTPTGCHCGSLSH